MAVVSRAVLILALLPFLTAARNPPACHRQGLYYKKLKECPTLTKFCKSFLHTSGKLSPITETAPATTVTSTSTVTVNTTPTDLITSFVATSTRIITDVTSTTTMTITTACAVVDVSDGASEENIGTGYAAFDTQTYSVLYNRPRSVPAPTGPSCGVTHVTSSVVSTDCHCLIIPTVTTTPKVIRYTKTTVTMVAQDETVTIDATTVVQSTTDAIATATVTAACVPDTSCNNAGLDWAYWRVPSQRFDGAYDPQSFTVGNPSTFDPTLYYPLRPQALGVTLTLAGIIEQGTFRYGNIYGHNLGYDEFVLAQVGYFFAPVDGVYTFFIDLADNFVGVWVGSPAYAGANADALILVDFTIPPPANATVTLSQGTLNPIRIVFGAGLPPNYLALRMEAPDGTVVLESGQGPSPYFVTQSCGGSSGPFAEW